jgi:hypothetical protein
MRPELGQVDQPPLPSPSPLWVRLEAGALYNSNVQLSPISRELVPGDRASAQLGSSQTIGLSHTKLFDWSWLSLVRVGGEFQSAPLEGSSYAFRGTMFYIDAEVPCPWGCLLVLQGAHGYRTYPDFEFTPERDENIWRAGVELRKPLSQCWSISGTFLYDRFASDNEQFDASRYTTGLFAVLQQ